MADKNPVYKVTSPYKILALSSKKVIRIFKLFFFLILKKKNIQTYQIRLILM